MRATASEPVTAPAEGEPRLPVVRFDRLRDEAVAGFDRLREAAYDRFMLYSEELHAAHFVPPKPDLRTRIARWLGLGWRSA